MDEHIHVAMPKLYGAPAYARPTIVAVQPLDRPFDPDALPLEALQTEEERQIARELAGRPYAGAAASEPVYNGRDGAGQLRGRPFRLRAITGRFRSNGASAKAMNGAAGGAAASVSNGTTASNGATASNGKPVDTGNGARD